MLSKQHHKAIAEIVKKCTHNEYDPTEVIFANPGDLGKYLADYFQQDNPQFDRDKFLNACGL